MSSLHRLLNGLIGSYSRLPETLSAFKISHEFPGFKRALSSVDWNSQFATTFALITHSPPECIDAAYRDSWQVSRQWVSTRILRGQTVQFESPQEGRRGRRLTLLGSLIDSADFGSTRENFQIVSPGQKFAPFFLSRSSSSSAETFRFSHHVSPST